MYGDFYQKGRSWKRKRIKNPLLFSMQIGADGFSPGASQAVRLAESPLKG